ncbi:MAG: phage holin family protein [Pseudomonadota bacterium]
MEEMRISPPAAAPGLVAGAAALARNVFGLLVARLELAALELSEVRNHVLELLGVFILAVLCVWFALACASALIVALAWDSMGWTILLLLFLVYLGFASWLWIRTRAMLRQGRLAFPETMNELRNDREMLL